MSETVFLPARERVLAVIRQIEMDVSQAGRMSESQLYWHDYLVDLIQRNGSQAELEEAPERLRS